MKTQALIDEFTKRASDGGGVPTDILRFAEAVRDDLATLQEQQMRTFATAVVTKYKLDPHEVLVVKLGDPACGYIPSPEVEARVLEMFEAVLKGAGIPNQVLVYNYAIDLTQVAAAGNEPAARRALNFWAGLNAIAGRKVDWRPVAEAVKKRFHLIVPPLTAYATAVGARPPTAPLPDPEIFFAQSSVNDELYTPDVPYLVEALSKE